MEKEITALAFIPAKLDSRRLSKKNLRELDGKALIEHSIQYALDSEIVKEVWISTEDASQLMDIVGKYPNVYFIDREPDLLGDAEVCDVYVRDLNRIYAAYSEEEFDYFVGLQPDNVYRQNKLDTLIKYAYTKKYNDLVTVKPDGSRSGSVRVTEFREVLNGNISRRVGTYFDNCVEIHTQEDLDDAKNKSNC